MGLIRVAALALALAGPAAAADARFDWFDYAGRDPVAAAGPGDYRNPVLPGFHPDPSVTRVGEDYYLVTSTFAYFPGLPVFHSRDLVTWTQIGSAIDRPGQLDFTGLGLSRGVFAPDITHNAGVFYILNTCVDCGGNYLLTAKDPAGPWSDPLWLKDIDGIDPSFFFDDDGRTYILNNGPPEGAPLYDGHRAIWVQEFDLAAKRPIGPRKVLVNGGVDLSKKPIWIEGPHIFKRSGWYYLNCAEGGTAEGHSQVILRSRAALGPYEANPGNPILTQRDLPRDRPRPITSAGHAELVQTAKGDWWATFLATRPYAGDFYNTGRETFLLPVTWTAGGWPVILPLGQAIPGVHRRPDLPASAARPGQGRNTGRETFLLPVTWTAGGWPVILPLGQAIPGVHRRPDLPASAARPGQGRDAFDGAKLTPGWLMIRNPKTRWYALRGGALELQARAEPLGGGGQPSYLGRRQQHLSAEASTRVRFTPGHDGDRAGLVALQSADFFYALTFGQDAGRTVVKLERRAGKSDPVHGVVLASAPVPRGAPVELKITARQGVYDFAYARKPGRWTTLMRDADGAILSTKTAGGFVGATLGLYAFSPDGA